MIMLVRDVVMKKLLLSTPLFIFLLISCGGSPSTNQSYQSGGYVPDFTNPNESYTDRDGHTWYRNNIYAPGPNESMNDDSYKKKWNHSGANSDPYSEGYEDGYEEGYRAAEEQR